MRTVWFFTNFIFSLLVVSTLLPLWHLFGLLGLKNKQRSLSHYTSYYWARYLVWIAGHHVEVKGYEKIPKEGPVLFISNHQGNFDIPVLLGYLNKPKGFLAKIEIAKLPGIHSWMRKMDCVFIDRSDMRQSIKAINKCAEVLKSGQSMVIFPEGTRSKGPLMGEFKKGSLRLVEKVPEVLVVPVSINGTYKAMESNNNRIEPAKVLITIGDPVCFAGYGKEEKDKIAEQVHNTISSNLIKMQNEL